MPKTMDTSPTRYPRKGNRFPERRSRPSLRTTTLNVYKNADATALGPWPGGSAKSWDKVPRQNTRQETAKKSKYRCLRSLHQTSRNDNAKIKRIVGPIN